MIHRIAVSLCASLLLVTSAADAATFAGRTSQQRYASVVTAPDGLVKRIRISYSAPCGDPRYRFPNVLRIERPFDASSTDDVTERLKLDDKLTGGGRSRQTVTVTAHRTVDADGAESWSGTFKTRAVLTRGGKKLDTCELKRVTWSATPTS